MIWNHCSTLLLLCCIGFAACAGGHGDEDAIKRDHAAIAALLDKALLEPDPRRAFEQALPVVRTYASVDSAWISGSTFIVAYKGGGTVTWMVPPPGH